MKENTTVDRSGSSNMNGYEIRWSILQNALRIVEQNRRDKIVINEHNADLCNKPREYQGDISIDDALKMAERLYSEFVTKK